MALGQRGLIVAVLALLFTVGCSSKPCRGVNLKEPLLKQSEVFNTEKKEDPSMFREWVYKYDGSKQCNMGKPLTPKQMRGQLSGIEVFKTLSKNDGLLHITVCGSPTGQANLYWIDKKDLKGAEERGFSVWNFGKVD